MRRTTLRLLVVSLAVVGLLPALAVVFGLSLRQALPPSPPPDAAQTSPVEGLDLECVAPRPETVDDLNTWINRGTSVGGDAGADVGASVELSDGRSLWVFGDTVRSKGAPGPSFVRNSMLVVDEDCIRSVSTPDAGAVIPDAADGTAYWPISIDHIADDGGDRVAVGLFRIKAFGEGAWDFTVLGTSLAEFWVPTGGSPSLVKVADIGGPASDATPTWGVAVALDKPWIHLYGTSHTEGESGWALHVARTRLAHLLNPAQWQYWDGARWGDDGDRTSPVIPGDGGVSRVLSVFQRDDRWYAVSKRDDFLGSDLVIWKGDSPHGPFVATPAVQKIPSTPDQLQYMALAHPHLLPQPGTIVVSWSRNGGGLDDIRADPTRYRPVFARVPLP